MAKTKKTPKAPTDPTVPTGPLKEHPEAPKAPEEQPETPEEQPKTPKEQSKADEPKQPKEQPKAPDTPAKLPQSRLFKGTLGIVTVLLLRLVVGGVFAFSGFAKAIDPWGSVYKFSEYLSAFGLADLDWSLLFLAISAGTIEFALGVFMIFGIYRRFTPAMMLLAMLVMLPVTGYLAFTDAVADCGCFGDALVLSNWGTFAKNVILTPLILYLCAYNRFVKNVYGIAVQWMVAFLSMAYAMVLAFIGYYMQPLIDFRPYPVGTSLAPRQADNSTAGQDFEYIYEKGGVQRAFGIDSLPGDDWNYVDRRLKAGKTDPVAASDASAVTVYDHGDDVTAEVFDPDRQQLLILFPDLAGVNISYTYMVNELCDFAQARGADVYGLTSGTAAEIAEWRDISMAAYPLYSVDDSQLKMLARGNPSVVMLSGGRIMWKRTLSSIDPARLDDNLATLQQLGSDMHPQRTLHRLTAALVAAMAILLAVNRSHRLALLALRRTKRKKSQTDNDNKK